MPNDWVVTYFDVGHGDATDIRLPCAKHILIDAGPCVGRGGEDDGNALCQWIANGGHHEFEYVVITHNHKDHFGGLQTLIRMPNVQVKNVVFLEDIVYQRGCNQAFKELLELIAARGIPQILTPVPGPLHKEAGLQLSILHPPVEMLAHPSSDPNATSMILSLERVGGECLALWCGDAKVKSVSETAKRKCPMWMMGPHHGHPQGLPKSSNYKEKLAQVAPRCLYLSFGRHYKTGIPCRDYIVGARLAGVRVSCSEVAQCCSPDFEDDVFNGNAILGIDGIPGSHQCRGSLQLTFSATAGAGSDPYEVEFNQAIDRKLTKSHCGR